MLGLLVIANMATLSPSTVRRGGKLTLECFPYFLPTVPVQTKYSLLYWLLNELMDVSDLTYIDLVAAPK